ncbi:MAG: Crp/Fnr family transcriptional regulator [Planctomycetes bacterium]|nr:Crp/Fnr family transcriptional regulator [Planctomycetota bacterium]
MAPERFLKLISTHPKVAIAAMTNLGNVIRVATERIMDLSTLGANNRVHGELLRLALAADNGDNSATLKPIPVHADMPSRASTTRETVARVLSALARKKLVRRDKDSLHILDVEKFEQMVEEVLG